MAKVVKANLKMKIKGGQASAAPPVGSTLGQYGVNMMDFIQPFNDATRMRLFGATALALMRWEPRIRLIRVQLFQGVAAGSYTLDLDCVLVDAAKSSDYTRLSIPLRYRSH